MLTGAATCLLLLIVLLAIPLALQFEVSWRENFQEDIRLEWAFGLVRVRIPSDQEERRQEVDHAKDSTHKHGEFLAVFRQKAFRRRIFRFVGELWHALHKKDLSLRVRVGLGDPAETGQLWAVVGPVAGVLASVQEASIAIEPEFFDTVFELDTSGSIRIIPLQIIYLIVALLLSPPVWHGLRQLQAAGR